MAAALVKETAKEDEEDSAAKAKNQRKREAKAAKKRAEEREALLALGLDEDTARMLRSKVKALATSTCKPFFSTNTFHYHQWTLYCFRFALMLYSMCSMNLYLYQMPLRIYRRTPHCYRLTRDLGVFAIVLGGAR
jgi:hypothetical protein